MKTEKLIYYIKLKQSLIYNTNKQRGLKDLQI